MFSGSNIAIHGGTFNSSINHASRGMDVLMEWVATGAFHNSDELYDAPKCHPRTRVAVLNDIMKWVCASESAQDDFMLWLFGPAGAGKSAIAKRIAEIAAEKGLLIADFFFFRTSPTRGNKDRLIATLAYQLAVSIPGTRPYIEDAIERDPAIFNKNILTQIDNLLIRPFQSILSTQTVPCPKLIIIDGLDECNDSKSQVSILEAISRSFPQHNLPIKFLIVSRPEISLVTLFTSWEPLKSIHRRLALDDTYRPDDDIHLFFSDKFEQIRLTHPLRSTIPMTWPTEETLETLVVKSSGQFIYASTVVKFVESISHRPTTRLNIILGISLPENMNPFAELDALYNHLLSSVDDIKLTLRVLSLYVIAPNFTYRLCHLVSDMSPELFLSLEPGDIQLALMNLSSILTYDESSGAVDILHASLVDFLSDKHRSTIFYIDKPSACIDLVHRTLQSVKGPDGIRAGDIRLFRGLNYLSPWILRGQLRTDILNFDFDAFINASIRWRYHEEHPSAIAFNSGSTIETFDIWMRFLDDAGLDEEMNEAFNKSFESRLRIYQYDWRLQLLLTLAVANVRYYGPPAVPYCRCVDILLVLDDHNLHLADQDALDLRHVDLIFRPRMMDIISSYVDGDTYASAALYCMRFLSNPPQYSMRNDGPEIGLIYAEWKETCDMTFKILCTLLQQANTLPELVQFISNHDIHPVFQKIPSVDCVSELNAHILAFLSRACVCINWRIISAIQQSLLQINDKPPSNFDENDERPDKPEDLKLTQNLIRQRLDQCCNLNAFHFKYNNTGPGIAREAASGQIAETILARTAGLG